MKGGGGQSVSQREGVKRVKVKEDLMRRGETDERTGGEREGENKWIWQEGS